jgi:hypothetical protein
MHFGHAIEVRTPVRNENRYMVQVHDLISKKLIFKHSSEEAERMGVLPAGPGRAIVYEYKRNDRNTEPYFKLIPYDLSTGEAGDEVNFDYWSSARHNPNQFQLVGNLLLVREHQTLRAWRLPL